MSNELALTMVRDAEVQSDSFEQHVKEPVKVTDFDLRKIPVCYNDYLRFENLTSWPSSITSEYPMDIEVEGNLLGTQEDIIKTLFEAAPALRMGRFEKVEKDLAVVEDALHFYSDYLVTEDRALEWLEGRCHIKSDLNKAFLTEVAPDEKGEPPGEQTGELGGEAAAPDGEPRASIDTKADVKTSKSSMQTAGTDEVLLGTKKHSVEFCVFPGFHHGEMIELPGQLEAPPILNRVTKAQNFNAGFRKFWKKVFLSEASVAVMQDLFWWFFLDVYKTEMDSQKDQLFDRIADSFCALFVSIHPDVKDKFLEVYPDCLAQAVYTTYLDAFPQSSERFDDPFKQKLINLVNEWTSGIKRQPGQWRGWNTTQLGVSGGPAKTASSLSQSQRTIDLTTGASSLTLDTEGFRRVVESLGSPTSRRKSRRMTRSGRSLTPSSPTPFKDHRSASKELGVSRDHFSISKEHPSVTKDHPSVTKSSGVSKDQLGTKGSRIPSSGSRDLAIRGEPSKSVDIMSPKDDISISKDIMEMANELVAAAREDASRITPTKDRFTPAKDQPSTTKDVVSFVSKELSFESSSSVVFKDVSDISIGATHIFHGKESHQMGPGCKLERMKFNLQGLSPLITHCIYKSSPTVAEVGLPGMKVRRTEIIAEPAPRGTYQELINNSANTAANLKKEYERSEIHREKLQNYKMLSQLIPATLLLLVYTVKATTNDGEETVLATDCPGSCLCVNKHGGITMKCYGVPPRNNSLFPNVTRLSIWKDHNFNGQGISIVLEATSNLRRLQIHDFWVTGLRTRLFDKLDQLEELDLCGNPYLQHIEADAFHNLGNLRTIRFCDMSRLSQQTLQTAFESLKSNKTETLIIDYLAPSKSLSASFLHPFRHSPLKRIVITNMGIAYLDPDLIYQIMKATCIDLSGNGFSASRDNVYTSIAVLSELRMIEYTGIYRKQPTEYKHIGDICMEPLPNSTEVTDLEQMWVNDTEKMYINCGTVVSAPKNLRYFVWNELFDYLDPHFLDPSSFSSCIDYGNYIRYVDTKDVKLMYTFKTVGLLRLQFLNAQRNDIDKLQCETFCNVPSMVNLLVGENKLGPAFKQGNATFTLTKMKELASIDFASCDITRISSQDFRVLTQIKFVNLSDNRIDVESINYAVDFNFAFLNLSKNSLAYLPSNFMESIEKAALKFHNKSMQPTTNFAIDLTNFPLPVIDISENPIECSCRSLQFIKWFKIYKKHFHNHRTYSCVFDSEDFKLETFNEGRITNCTEIPEPKVEEKPRSTAVITSTLSTIFVLILLALLAYRYRTQLKYYLYYRMYITLQIAKHRINNPHNPWNRLDEIHPEYDHDVFILCSADDRKIILEEIRPGLISNGFTVLLGEEDFIPGGSITDEIVKGLSSSMCALLVLSSNFLRSPWLDYEVTMAIAMSCKVIMVKLDDPPYRLMPPALIYLHKQHETRQRYPIDRPEDLPNFWRNLTRAINRMGTTRF